ncbi:alanine--tRNA ligase, partial [candidate division KSB1 bacterium]|nr:alanine--tRNA ligase [candidate division KSB1 bacterium]
HIVPSAPVVPQNDPTLLFTNAGMNQFKDIFLGNRKVQYPRVADSQKCIRVSGKHNDLEEVGRDTYHHTFFEMLGNWSFGDYFKKEAIRFGWQLLTKEWGLDKNRLYATVFAGDAKDGLDPDNDAADEWKQETDIDPKRVLAFGKKDNFWEMGETGPCGPCSEIHIDRGPEYCDSTDPDHVCGVNAGCSRFIELWNLVFIQYNRDKQGVLLLLPSKHVDTGAGFERLAAVLQNKVSNYDIDLFEPIINRIAELTGKDYTVGETGVAFRVLTDHIRALSFAIADGAIPSNEARGYVLRRILRRGARFGRVLGKHEPFIYKLVAPLAETMGDAYPELRQRQEYIERVIRAEEESFGKTLDRGIELFEQKVQNVLALGKSVFPGSDAFLLHDTYGFPLDLTQLMAEEKKLTVDVEGFNREMKAQRKRSSMEKASGYDTLNFESEKHSTFVGYENDKINTKVLHYEDGRLVLEETPFYAESGGQIGDRGRIFNDNFQFRVEATRYIGENIVHFGSLLSGEKPKSGEAVNAEIDRVARRATERNHTVTHLAHAALRQVLGDHVHQAGSLVHFDHMRFDFTHFEKVKDHELKEIETIVNEHILNNHTVQWQVMALEEAKKKGAMALFGEKYDERVRVIEINDLSRELCGGTHVKATGQIGPFVIVGESAVAAGIRRIECLTGFKALRYLNACRQDLETAAKIAGCPVAETASRFETLLQERKTFEQELDSLRRQTIKIKIQQLLSQSFEKNGIKIVHAEIHVPDVNALKASGDLLRDGLGSGIGVLAARFENKGNFLCVVTQDLKLKAGDIVKKVAQIAGGSGGGGPHMALAGTKDVAKIDLALSKVKEIIGQMINEGKDT